MIVIIIIRIEYRFSDLKLNLSLIQYFTDIIIKSKSEAIIGSHKISKIAPTAAK